MTDGESGTATRARAPTRAQAATALALTLPAPTLGLIAALYIWPETGIGQLAFAISKLWLIVLPVVWLMLVERQRPRIPRPRLDGMAAGVGTGLAIVGVVVGAYLLVGHWIDPAAMVPRVEALGLGTLWAYALGAVYWCTVNSILEEYVWRWFVFTRCEALMPRFVAAVAAGLFFTVHHVVALAYYFDWRVTLLASAGVFIGGTTWSWVYLRWRNLYAAYVSHVLADLAVFGVGWHILFVNGGA